MTKKPETEAVVEFAMGEVKACVTAGTILECLQAAEQGGLVPLLPDDWKETVPDSHRVLLEGVENA